MGRFEAGLVSVSFRELSVVEIIKLAKEAGLSFIEWGSDVHAPFSDEKRLSEIALLSKEWEIGISSYGTYYKIGQNKKEEIIPYIKAAKILGTDVLRIWCEKAEDRDELICECIMLSKIAESENVKLCLECHNGTFTENIDDALYLMDKVNSENFRMYYQPNQFKSEEENLIYAERIAPFTENIHVFNWMGNEKYPLAEGRGVWEKYLSFFKGGKLLLEFMPDGKKESLKTEAKSLFDIMEELK